MASEGLMPAPDHPLHRCCFFGMKRRNRVGKTDPPVILWSTQQDPLVKPAAQFLINPGFRLAVSPRSKDQGSPAPAS
jgi:hypothetical protein